MVTPRSPDRDDVKSPSRKGRSPVWLSRSSLNNNSFPQRVAALFEKGVAHQNAGKMVEAQKVFCRVAQLLERAGVQDASIYAAIGYTHLLLNEPEKALELSQKSLAIDPKFVKALINASAACRILNKLDAAQKFAENACELDPNSAQPLGALAMLLIQKGKISEGLVRATYALQIDSDCIDTIGALALGYSRIGDIETALPFFDRYMERLPNDPTIGSGKLFSLHYKPGVTAVELRESHRSWGDRFGAKFKPDWPAHKNDRNPKRRLRIGYLSGDLRAHVVGYWTKHIIAAHNRDNVEIFCFANNKEDEYSAQIKAASDYWLSILDMPDEQASRTIQEAKIDVLVDLSGHTSANRLFLLARKPAPVQATWCGYLDSTGLEAVDYVIADEVIAPASEPSPFVEEPLRLPSCSVCFEPIPDAPEVDPPPFERNGYITFGCFNNPSKIGPGVAALWSKILNATLDAKLLLMYGNFVDPLTRERLLRCFREAGIPDKRVEFRQGNRATVLAAYSADVDLALDTFPYNGGTTTCEALWMGVPTVGLYGSHPMSRLGCSLLVYSGLSALATTSPEEYVERAVSLANERSTLRRLRSELRGHLVKTPLFNANLFIAGLEDAYFRAFERWCHQQTQSR
jgi:protein O-GlcNAc transferase